MKELLYKKMGDNLILTLLLALCVLVDDSLSREVSCRLKYWTCREWIVEDESKMMLGGDLVLEDWEQLANKTLMEAKHREIDQAIKDPSMFLPAQNFLEVADKIRESPVFKIIQLMPKGANLHVHSKAMVSSDFIVSNITHRPNLFICEHKGTMKLKFFDVPTKDCDWQLLSDLRKIDKKIDDRIRSRFVMRTEEPAALAYATVDDAWNKFEEIFKLWSPLLNYRPVYEDHFYQGLKELYDDNVMYVEVRTSLSSIYELDGTIYNSMQVVKICQKVAHRFMKDHPDFVGVKIIYTHQRQCNASEMEKQLEKAHQLNKRFPDFIAGFDLVGQEEKGQPLTRFAEKLLERGNDKIPFFFHAGETGWYGTNTDQNLIDAVLLNSKRIGHGFALSKHPKVMDMVREKKIAIEVSPISNQVLCLVKDLRNHPAATLFASDFPVVVANDDPSLWGAKGLSYDFYEAFVGIMSRSADLRALKKLALNSIKYSGMSEEEKSKAVEVFDRRWRRFVEKLDESG